MGAADEEGQWGRSGQAARCGCTGAQRGTGRARTFQQRQTRGCMLREEGLRIWAATVWGAER